MAHIGRGHPIAALLIVALAAILTGCSPSEPGGLLPSGFDGEIAMNHLHCSLNGSGTEATATGTFPVPVEYPPGDVPSAGHGGFTLRFYVYGDNQQVGNQDLLGFSSEATRLRSRTWQTQASVRTGMRPTDCQFSIFQNSY